MKPSENEDVLDEPREDSEGEEREDKKRPRRTFLMSSIPTKALLLSGLCTGTRENPLSLRETVETCQPTEQARARARKTRRTGGERAEGERTGSGRSSRGP